MDGVGGCVCIACAEVWYMCMNAVRYVVYVVYCGMWYMECINSMYVICVYVV